MKTIFALLALGLLGCGPEKDDTGESPEADADTDADSDTDADGDADDCNDDSPVPEEWPEVIDDADVFFYYGTRVAAAGDINGDGYDDIIIDSQEVTEGPLCDFADAHPRAHLRVENYNGPSDAQSAGDVDGDGLGDLVVGDQTSGTNGDYAGAVFLVLSPMGTSTYLPYSAEAELFGEETNDGLGLSVAGVGDVDGDGVSDLLAGAIGQNDGAGAAWLIPGTTRGDHMVSEVGMAIRGSAEHYWVGTRLAPLGDADGDGLTDFAVTSGQYTPAVAVFRGPVLADAAFEDADALLLPDPADDESGGAFGVAVSSAGDQNGDGLPDIAVGAIAESVWAERDGAVYVFGGAVTGTQTAIEAQGMIAGDSPFSDLGHDLDFAGDVDGDGWDDLIVGASDFDGVGGGRGAIHIIFGPVPAGTQRVDSLGVRVVGTGEGHEVGACVAGVGDTNGDGFDDLLVAGWADMGDGLYSPSTLLLGRPAD